MKEFIDHLPVLLSETIISVVTSIIHNWLPLSLAILTASLMKVFIDVDKLKQSILKKPKVSILASVAFGAFTPLCACGTMAVVIGLLTTALPWGPVIAFLTSSPLMSPDGFIMIAGILSLKFAIALAIASVVIGLVSGGLTHFIEKKTGFLKDQLRFTKSSKAQDCCSAAASEATCGCTASVPSKLISSKDKSSFARMMKKLRIKEVGKALVDVGLKQILLYFTIFAGVGYLIQSFVPTSLIVSLFSGESIFSVPLAALIGLPLYVSGEGAIPVIKALIEGGAGEGAMMAFMITGPATSAWVIAGITSFMKKRVVGLYVSYIFIGGIIIGYIYQLLIAMGL